MPLFAGEVTPSTDPREFEHSAGVIQNRFMAHAIVALPDGWNETIDRRLREHGIVILRPIHGRAFLASVRATHEQLLAAVRRCRIEIAPIHASLKVAPNFASWSLDVAAKPPDADCVRALVRFHEDVTTADASSALLGAGVSARRSQRCPCWEACLSDADREHLARQDAVALIEPDDRRLRWLLWQGRSAVGAEAIQGYSWNGGSGAFTGSTGSGTVVGIVDQGGLPVDHPAFWSTDASGALTPGNRIRANVAGVNDHTAHVAGIACGSGGDTPALYGGGWGLRGVAPRADLAVVVATGNEYEANKEAIVEAQADVTNNSYGFSLYNAVTFAADNDAIVRGDARFDSDGNGIEDTPVPPRLSVWGAGNNGTAAEKGALEERGYWSVLNPQKNGIVVGGSLVNAATVPPSASARWEGSSIGPTLDGRLKPDVVAPACKAIDAQTDAYFRVPNGDSPYVVSRAYEPALPCGTSYSTAFVTGVASLLLEQWKASYTTAQPYPSTLKAALIQGASDIVGDSMGPYLSDQQDARLLIRATAGPDFATGFGEVAADASLAVVRERRLLEDSFLVQGDAAAYVVNVPDGSTRLRVTLAWDDPEALNLAATAAKLQNDLDLELFGPLESSPQTYSPWSLPVLTEPALRTPDQAPQGLAGAGRGADHTNNVEQVEISAPAAGTWEIHVKATTLPSQDGQTFSLAADYPMTDSVSTSELRGRIGRFAYATPTPSQAALYSVLHPDISQSIVLPARDVCRIPRLCPGCERFGKCPPVDLTLQEIPSGWAARLVRPDGSTIAKAKRSGSQAILRWDRGKARNALIAITPPKKTPPQPDTAKVPIRIVAGPAR